MDGVAASMQKLTAKNLEYHGGSQNPNAEPSVDDTELSSVVSNKNKTPARSTANNPNVSGWDNYAKANSKHFTEYTGYDSTGVAHQRVRPPSTVDSEEYRSSRASGFSKFGKNKVCNALEFPRPPPMNPDLCIQGSGNARAFAKPRRSPTPPPLPVITRAVVGRQVEYSDNSSDDEWGVID